MNWEICDELEDLQKRITDLEEVLASERVAHEAAKVEVARLSQYAQVLAKTLVSANNDLTLHATKLDAERARAEKLREALIHALTWLDEEDARHWAGTPVIKFVDEALAVTEVKP